MTDRPDTNRGYDPREFWDRKALRAEGDALRAVCHDSDETNRVIGGVQRRALAVGLRRVAHRAALRGARMLDFGCGTGRWVDFFEAVGLHYTGVDISVAMLRIARVLHPSSHFTAIEGDRLPFPADSFDLLCSVTTMHHNDFPRQVAIAFEMERVLAPGGHAVLFEALGQGARTSGHSFPLPREGWESLMTSAGLRAESYRGARYSILRTGALRCARKLSGHRPDWKIGSDRPWWQRVVDDLDVLVDPLLGARLPARLQTRGLMIFRKPERTWH